MALSYKKLSDIDLSTLKVADLKAYIKTMASKISEGLRSADKDIRERARNISMITGLKRTSKGYAIKEGTGKMRKKDLLNRAMIFQSFANAKRRKIVDKQTRKRFRDLGIDYNEIEQRARDRQYFEESYELNPRAEKAYQTFIKNHPDMNVNRYEWESMVYMMREIDQMMKEFGSDWYILYNETNRTQTFYNIGETLLKIIRKTSGAGTGLTKEDINDIAFESLMNPDQSIDEIIKEHLERLL